MNGELVVVGAGPAGIEAALEAARLGWQVHLVSDGPVGGRAGWHSLLPSKVWLDAAEEARHGRPVAAPRIVASVAAVKEAWNEQARQALVASQVTIHSGVAVFSGPSSLVVQDGDGAQMAVFEDMPVIAAPGSVPVFPGPLKPDGKRVLAPRFLSKLDKLPQSMIVVGAGATGCESAYLFNALGLNVTWIVDQYGILPQFYQPAGIALGEALSDQGVTIRAGHMVAELQREEDRVTAVLVDGATYAAEMAFVAVGRRPDWDRLNLAAAGVAPADDQPLALSAFGQTANPLVYVVGDADGRAMTANKAAAQARIAARHACGAETAAFSLDFVPQPVFSEPQVAQVGQMDGEGITVVRVPFTESLKGHILNDQGFVALAYEEESGRVRGATAIGPHAADVVAPVMTALSMQATVSALAGLYGAYPTVSELPFIAAREAMGP